MKKRFDMSGEALRYLERSLLSFSQDWQLSIEIDHILLAVYNTAINAFDMLDSDFILFDRHKDFVNKFKTYIPKFYHTFHEYIQNFCELLNISTDSHMINYLLFTLITYWDDLISGYIKNHLQVSLVIISDQHFSHAKMIKNILELELPREVTIDALNVRRLTHSVLKDLPYDIIISNFELSLLEPKEHIVIHDFPTRLDINTLKAKINNIREGRNGIQRISEANN